MARKRTKTKAQKIKSQQRLLNAPEKKRAKWLKEIEDKIEKNEIKTVAQVPSSSKNEQNDFFPTNEELRDQLEWESQNEMAPTVFFKREKPIVNPPQQFQRRQELDSEIRDNSKHQNLMTKRDVREMKRLESPFIRPDISDASLKMYLSALKRPKNKIIKES